MYLFWHFPVVALQVHKTHKMNQRRKILIHVHKLNRPRNVEIQPTNKINIENKIPNAQKYSS